MTGKDFWQRIEIVAGKTNWVDIAEKIGIKHSTLWAMYNNKTIPKADIAYKLSQYFGCSLDWLLTGSQKQDYLTAIERELIENYRSCDTTYRIAVESTARDGSNRNRQKILSEA